MAHRFVKHMLASAAVSCAFVFPAAAQYAGPVGEAGQVTVKAILANPVDDQYVKLEGHLLRKTGDEKYVFSDGTGEIVAEIDDEDFPAQKVDDKTRVEIVGEVDTSRRRAPEIDVDALRVIN